MQPRVSVFHLMVITFLQGMENYCSHYHVSIVYVLKPKTIYNHHHLLLPCVSHLQTDFVCQCRHSLRACILHHYAHHRSAQSSGKTVIIIYSIVLSSFSIIFFFYVLLNVGFVCIILYWFIFSYQWQTPQMEHKCILPVYQIPPL